MEFLDRNDYSSLDVSEIANTDVPLFDPSFGQKLDRFIGIIFLKLQLSNLSAGLRVAACVEVVGKGLKWMAGTVGATFGSHGDDFLVFFSTAYLKHSFRYFLIAIWIDILLLFISQKSFQLGNIARFEIFILFHNRRYSWNMKNP